MTISDRAIKGHAIYVCAHCTSCQLQPLKRDLAFAGQSFKCHTDLFQMAIHSFFMVTEFILNVLLF